MKDVAKEAGVALGTVSKVVNNIPVGDDYKIKVENAIEKLGYKVNTYARGLKTQKTNTVALIIPDLINPFFSELAHYTETYLFDYGYKLMLCCSQGKCEKELFYINMASQNKVDGIIAITYSDISDYVSSDLPFISIDRHFNNSIQCVASDNYTGGFIATEKLIESGCKHPAYVRKGSIIYGETNKRKFGYLEACEKHNIEPVILDLHDGEDTIECFKVLLDQTRKENGQIGIDGIFAVSDFIGYEIIQYLESINLKVPGNIQVVGFDGIRHFGHFDYYMSTIHQHVDRIAKVCVEILLSPNKKQFSNPYLLPVDYEYGNTTLL
jgi:LacI family transcriptional regulator